MNSLEIFNCEQNSPEWFASRAGIVTASEFDSVMAKGKAGEPSKTRRTYMLKLIGEQLTGATVDGFSNKHTERGHEMEPDARRLYAFQTDLNPEQVGFMRRGQIGCSPDSLIGADGLLEIKTKLPHLQLEVLLSGQMPPEHKPQVQGQLLVTGRAWVDFVSYWPGLPLFIKRIERDEPYIASLRIGIEDFLADMRSLRAQIDNDYFKRAA